MSSEILLPERIVGIPTVTGNNGSEVSSTSRTIVSGSSYVEEGDIASRSKQFQKVHDGGKSGAKIAAEVVMESQERVRERKP